MIYLELFLTFLEIGAVSFGGGMGMISLIRESVLSHGWLTEEELLNFIAVSESTPGPIAVNIATFVGSSQAGIPGAFFATLGIVFPSFLIILFVATLFKKLVKYAGVNATIQGMQPAIIGMMFATFLTMFLSVILGVKTIESSISFDWKGLLIFGVLVVGSLSYLKIRKKSISPIILIIISGVFGVLLYGL